MKLRSIIVALVILHAGIILLIKELPIMQMIQQELVVQDSLFIMSHEKRPTITFILGEDRGERNYFSLAEEHFLQHDIEKTDAVVKHIRDIQSLINYLNRNYNTPLGIINIVVHGNMWSGLSTKISPEGERAYPKELYKTVLEKKLPILESYVADDSTKVNIWACGIGKNPLLNMALQLLFTNKDKQQAALFVSPDFVIFHQGTQGHAVRLNADYWPYFFKRGYRPSDSEIRKAFEKQYPEDSVNWDEALKNQHYSKSVFTKSFHIPVKWLVLYPSREERPSLNDAKAKLAWVKSQPELMAQIENLGIPFDRYTWNVQKVIHTKEDGSKVPAIKAIGMTTALCVLKQNGA